MEIIKKAFILFMTTIIVFTGVSAPAFASEAENREVNQGNNIHMYSSLTEEVLEDLESYIVVRDDQYHLELKSDVRYFAPEVVKQVREQLKMVNKSLKGAGITDLDIKNGNEYFISDFEMRENLIAAGIELPEEPEMSIMAHGVTKVEWYWWGVDVYLSATALKMIYGGVAGGATITAAALLTIPIIGWAIAAGIAGGVATVATQTQIHGYIFHWNALLGFRGTTRQ